MPDEQDEQTCGKGLAAAAPLPAMLADLTAAIGEVLSAHMRALDQGEEAGRREHEGYASLVAAHRDNAARLQAMAGEMASYRDLPPATHDMAVMTDGRQTEAFAKVVQARQALLVHLQEAAARDEAMLAEMRRMTQQG